MVKTPIRYWTLLGLLGEFGILGIVLEVYHVTALLWWIVQVIVVYLIWAGRAAIAPAIFAITGIMWLKTIHTPFPEFDWIALHLNRAQIWAIALVTAWLFAIVVAVHLASISSRFQANGYRRVYALVYLTSLTLLGIGLGHWAGSNLLGNS